MASAGPHPGMGPVMVLSKLDNVFRCVWMHGYRIMVVLGGLICDFMVASAFEYLAGVWSALLLLS